MFACPLSVLRVFSFTRRCRETAYSAYDFPYGGGGGGTGDGDGGTEVDPKSVCIVRVFVCPRAYACSLFDYPGSVRVVKYLCVPQECLHYEVGCLLKRF